MHQLKSSASILDIRHTTMFTTKLIVSIFGVINVVMACLYLPWLSAGFVLSGSIFFAACFGKQHTTSFIMCSEAIVLALCKWFLPSLTFVGYFLSKFVVSVIIFVVHRLLLLCHQPTIGTGLRLYNVNGKLYQYSELHLPKPGEHRDSLIDLTLTDLTPTVCLFGGTVDEFMEYYECISYDLEDPGVLEIMVLSGKCHDIAVSNIYKMSSDKFLSYSMLSFLRWQTWILVVFGLVLLWPSADQSGHFFDILVFCISVWDSANMDVDLLAKKRNREINTLDNFSFYVGEYFKLVLFILVWTLVQFYIDVACSPAAVFFLLVIFFVIVSTVFTAMIWPSGYYRSFPIYILVKKLAMAPFVACRSWILSP